MEYKTPTIMSPPPFPREKGWTIRFAALNAELTTPLNNNSRIPAPPLIIENGEMMA